MPKVSIVMPLYNAESYVSEAIESVRSQTYEDWELIVIDDCSTDSSKSKVVAYAEMDLRIHVHSNDRNLGAAFLERLAFNTLQVITWHSLMLMMFGCQRNWRTNFLSCEKKNARCALRHTRQLNQMAHLGT